MARGRLPIKIEHYRNIDGFIGQIIASGRATYWELKYLYILEEALDLYDNNYVNNVKNDRTVTVNFYGDIIGDESFLQKLESRFTQKLRAELGAL